MSSGNDLASAQNSEPATNMMTPARYTRPGPRSSPSAANGRIVAVTASWNALTTQIDSTGDAPRSRAIVGSAVLAICPSSTDIVVAIASAM